MARFTPFIAVLLLSLSTNASPVVPDQQVLGSSKSNHILQVRHELKKAEIIPTVIDDFLPTLQLDVKWSKKRTADLGNTLKPTRLQDAPTISLSDEPTSSSLRNPCKSNMTYTITLTDPDAPSRDDPEWSEMCHWIATGVPLKTDALQDCSIMSFSNLKDVMPYKPPGPPEKTGKHRYVFLVFAPENGTTIPLNVTKPSDRQHWGTGEERHGVRDWAAENKLVPVAANFIYAQHKKQ